TDDNVTFIENSCLAGGDAEGGLVEPKAEPIGCRLDVRRNRRRAITELRVGPGDRSKEATGRGHLASRQRSSRADDDGVRRGGAAERKGRLPDRDDEPTTLAGREAPEALVRPNRLAGLVDDLPGATGKTVPLQEVAVVAAAEEARLLALGPTRN